MNKQIYRILTVLGLAAMSGLAGCGGSQANPMSFKNDWRAGTPETPYMTQVPHVICDRCEF